MNLDVLNNIILQKREPRSNLFFSLLEKTKLDKIIVSGGGTNNSFLIERLKSINKNKPQASRQFLFAIDVKYFFKKKIQIIYKSQE